MKLIVKHILLITFLYGWATAYAQKPNDVYVDKAGVMRWGHTREEIKGFGINYTVPFAHAYRAAKKLNVDLEQAIDDDVYHFARLGFDAYRVHVWDTEISDSAGNLLDNEHLRLFDYMLKKMKDRGMKFLLTPIAYWGNGWPDPNEDTPGFSHKYGKGPCLTDEGCITAQERYLYQFLNHVNPYTQVAYKDDPDIVAFEVSNEPHHGGEPQKVTEFINRLVRSMRDTGCRKPILYNVSHSIHFIDAYFNADIQGGTFQWYPTGLGAHHELAGNFLPNVDSYRIPFADNPKFKHGAKIVYEFDAADVGRSYIYPAMARSFREAGIQWATHFAYDPTYLAYANTEYNTHYMNLVYAPQKALSLMVAAEVFYRVPMYKSFGRYPSNTTFDAFRVSYEKDLAEMITDKKFIYTNSTTTAPPAPEKLETLAGFGNSPVVTYEGLGAYFLDRIEKDVWRLEVLPDAIWVDNIFGRNSLDKTVAVLNRREWPMTIDLPGLGHGFSVSPLNRGNTFQTKVNGNTFVVAPGTYLLTKRGTTTNLKAGDRWKNITLGEYASPPPTVDKIHVLHSPAAELVEGSAYVLKATVVSKSAPESVEVTITGPGWRQQVFTLNHAGGYQYEAEVPPGFLHNGFRHYKITVTENGRRVTFPSGNGRSPSDLDLSNETYQVRVLPKGSPVYLFNAATDAGRLSWSGSQNVSVVPLAEPGGAELRVDVSKLSAMDRHDTHGPPVPDHCIRYSFGKKIQERQQDMMGAKQIVLSGRSLGTRPCRLQLALVMKNGLAFGGSIEVLPSPGDYALPVSDLKKVKLVTLPRPYPSFLPYFFESSAHGGLDLREVETLQISTEPGMKESGPEAKHGVAITSVRLE